MSFATDGDTEELAPGYRRRPISVAQLLEREGYRPVVRSRAARRALSGVAAGAVLTLGAVVGGLFLNHGQRTTGDLASTGLAQSGGDIVLAESNTPTTTTHAATTTTTPKTTTHTTRTTHNATPKPATITKSHQATTNARPTTTNVTPTTPTTARTATTPQVTSKHTVTTTQSTPAQPTTTPTTTTPPPTETTTTTPPQPTTTDGGLIGGVGQVLGSVTQPVFDWFH